jgi:hypothetical protein
MVDPQRKTVHMTLRKLAPLAAFSLVIALLASCGSPSKPKRSANDCVTEIAGQKLFVGNATCMKTLPARRMAGIWVLGPEYSVFHEGAGSNESSTPGNEVWLEVDPEKVLAANGLTFDGRSHKYKIEFIGTKSDAPGAYGHMGQFKRGAFVTRVIHLTEIN